MSSDRNSYDNILKAIGLFGGVKVFQILVGLIKNKVVAILLGPVGMGIVGMLNATTTLISSFTGFGLGTSTVRDVSYAYNSHDKQKIGRVASILRILILISGIIGVIITFVMADYLSYWAFGNDDYTLAFRILSIILLFDQLNVGETALMQGTFHYNFMAKASLYGSIISLIVSLPLYYQWGEKAIVPVIIISSLSLLVVSFFYSRKIELPHIKVSLKEVLTDGKTMIFLGIVLAATSTFRLGGVYVKRAFISSYGCLADVGLYMAGSAIVTQYIDVILGAMSSDYVPRLSAICSETTLFNETINRQMKLMVTLILPFIVLFVIFARELLILLYSNEFLPIASMTEWMMFAMFLRAVSWCLSFSFVAKGESKAFFWNDTICTIYSMFFSIVGYYCLGFIGLGLAFFVTYICYTIQMYFLAKKKFDFRFSPDCLILIRKQAFLLIVTFVIIEIVNVSVWRYVLGVILLSFVTYVSVAEINKMIPIKSILNNLKIRILRK